MLIPLAAGSLAIVYMVQYDQVLPFCLRVAEGSSNFYHFHECTNIQTLQMQTPFLPEILILMK